MLAFIDAVGGKLPDISAHFVADSRKNGGSLFRIYRDVRFSKDKSPNKTQAGVHFRHEEAKSAYAPGFYLHLEPGNVFAAAGIWHPDTPSLNKIRKGIDENQETWIQEKNNAEFKKVFQLEGESLVRSPRGYDKDHPLIADLRRKDFIAVCHLTQKKVLSPNFLEDYMAKCAGASGFMHFLTNAMELPY